MVLHGVLGILQLSCIVLSWYRPDEQGAHDASMPAVAAYLPTAHATQVAAPAVVMPPGPYVPFVHGVPVQAVAATPATYMPDAQLAQAGWPGVEVYMPAPQSIHVAASAVVCPVRPYLPATQDVPVHVLALAAPVAVECFPAAHLVHSVLPVVVVYLPALQAEHDVKSVAPCAVLGPNLPASHARSALHPVRGPTPDSAASTGVVPGEQVLQEVLKGESLYAPTASQTVQPGG